MGLITRGPVKGLYKDGRLVALQGEDFNDQLQEISRGSVPAVRVDCEALQAGTALSVYVPSPYDAATFAGLAKNVRDALEVRGKSAWEALSTTRRKDLLHPSVVEVPGGFSGYRWWMAFTPYCNGNSTFENPCVVASVDGRNWVLPQGAINPLVPAPSGTDFNADTHITFDDDGQQLVLIFVERGSTMLYVKVMTSKDGVSWTAPVVIWSGNWFSGGVEIISPSIYWDPSAAKWVIIGHNTRGGGRPLVKITSDNLTEGWTQTLTALTFNTPKAGRSWWHSHFQRTGSGQLVGMIQDNDGVDGNDGDVYLAWSDDGVNFKSRFIYPGGLYRTAMWASQVGEVVSVRAWLSGLNRADLRELNLAPGAAPLIAEDVALSSLLAMAKRGGSRVLAADDFARADSTAGANPLGSDLTGKVYTQASGSDTWGIVSGAAVNVTAGGCRVVVAAARDVDLRALIKTRNPAQDECNIIYRWVDWSNFYRLLIGVDSVAIQRVVAGVATTIATAAVTRFVPAGAIVRVVVIGSRHAVYVDGIQWVQVEDDANPTGAGVGFQSSGIAQGMAVEAFAAALP